MKANLFPLLLLFFSFPAWSGVSTDYEKEFSETYPVTNDTRVRLDNRYGEIEVLSWNQQQVKIDVRIRVNARSEEAFMKTLEAIDIDLQGSTSLVSATTSVDNRNTGGGWLDWLTGNGRSNEYKIYYTVRMPANLELDVKARYCDVNLPDLGGRTKLDVGYGDLVAGRLTNRSRVDVSYGSARIERLGNDSEMRMRYTESSVRNAGDLRYDGRYGEVRLGTVGALSLDIGYEEIDVESATEVRMDGNYNDLNIEKVGAIYLDGNYTDYDIGTVTRSAEVAGNYGDLEIGDLRAGFDRVRVKMGYADVDIDVDAAAGYVLDLRSRYGDIEVDTDKLSPRNVDREGTSESIQGTKAGRGSGRISVETSYGDIDIY